MKSSLQTNNNIKGFTLIEVAIVMLIVTFLIGSALMPLRAQRESANIQQAREELKVIGDALYGFAITNGHLPCPAIPGLGNNGGAGTDCNSFHGFVPSVGLGITGKTNCDGLMIDPWGNPYRYSITNTDAGFVVGGGADFVRTGEIQGESQSPNNLSTLTPDFRICSDVSNACNGATIPVRVVADNVVAAWFSMGSQWQNPSTPENQNAGEATVNSTCGLPAYNISNDTFFYSSNRIETGANRFDDIMFWMSPNILYAKMLAAGQLP